MLDWPRQGGQAGQEDGASVDPELAVVTPGAEHHVSEGLNTQLWWPRPASCWPGCWRGPTGWWCPPRRGPAGTGRRWCSPDSGSGPQGSAPPWWPGYLWVSMLDVWVSFVIWRSHLTETPAWADRITLSDPITVSRPELENSVFLLESVTTILSAVTRNPALSE